MWKPTVNARQWAALSLTALLISACGSDPEPTEDVVRRTSGSADTLGLWRIIEHFDNETFYSAGIMKKSWNKLEFTDCSRAFETEELTLVGNSYSGYDHDLASLDIINNDTMRRTFDGRVREFEKMSLDAEFDMGTFNLESPDLFNIHAGAGDLCTQFSDGDEKQVIVLSHEILGSPIVVTIIMDGDFREGTFSVEPNGTEDVMVFFSGPYWVTTTLNSSDEVSNGTLTITNRGNVWIEGTVEGYLRDGDTPVTVTFNVETPVN